MEIHEGLDGKYYLVDAARLFPPESYATRSQIFALLIPADSSLSFVELELPSKSVSILFLKSLVGVPSETFDIPEPSIQNIFL